MANAKFESAADYGKSLDPYKMTSLNDAMSNINLSNATSCGFLHDNRVNFDLSNYEVMEEDDNDDDAGFDGGDEIDLNKTYSSKTMTKKQMTLVNVALGDSEL